MRRIIGGVALACVLAIGGFTGLGVTNAQAQGFGGYPGGAYPGGGYPGAAYGAYPGGGAYGGGVNVGIGLGGYPAPQYGAYSGVYGGGFNSYPGRGYQHHHHHHHHRGCGHGY